ncbi:MAG: 50S ribosomal protein L4 [Dehalococcoidales bacterium]|nr:50S ribosomal protein L4 [Dehalococcoidales bacterium]
MQIPVYSVTGEVVRNIDVSDQLFGVPFNEAVVHQAMVRQWANTRQGIANTKTRGEVTGSRRKLFRQKHTGNARAGSAKSPLRRGGGVCFGPRPRDYSQAMPKKMRRLALKCLLSVKARDGELKVLESFELEKPKTREMVGILAALGIASSTLIVTGSADSNVIKSARNLPEVRTLPADLINVVDILSHKVLLMTEPAVRRAEQLWGSKVAVREER